MTGKPFLMLAFIVCCGLSAAGQVTNTPIKKDSAYNRAPVPPKAAIFSVKPVALHSVYYNHLGFMCRQELKLEKATKTSFRFRLGSVEYTDRMEGKGNAIIR
ncbi:hypothetical protein LL912_18300 [Niabella sp. CC-SYL272]|uniref:hypothetical protein n=1 Tax=Niabella agricola TaxID=2891571 RepID=UPI001F3F8959|nr:hypothetical protein [Niabella agricola]MCF3110741.1 hypothetical protein [Niabella agricola]